MIINIGKLSIWVGCIPLKKYVYKPVFSYLDGGCYWKISMLWFKFYFELSGPKKDNRVYKEVTVEELDRIIKEAIK